MKLLFTGVFAIAALAPFVANAWGSGTGGPAAPPVDYNPGVTITATPDTIAAGESATVEFYAQLAATNVTTDPLPDVSENCTADFDYEEVPWYWIAPPPAAPYGTKGVVTVSPTVTTTYTVNCRLFQSQDAFGVTYRYETQSVTVTVSALPDLTAGSITPTTATEDAAVTLSATISNSGGTTTGAGFTNLFQRATDGSGTGATDIGTYVRGSALAAAGTFPATLSYSFPSAGTWYVRACADKTSGVDTGTITESSESNNCGAWTAVSVTSDSVTCSLSSNPSPLTGGVSTTFTWSSEDADQCTGTGFATGGAEEGTSPAVTIDPGSIYQLQCSASGLNPCTEILTASQPAAEITADPDRVNAGEDTAITWTTEQCTSVSVTRNGAAFSTALTGTDVEAANITTQTVFVVSCDGGAATDSAIVNVVPKFEEF